MLSTDLRASLLCIDNLQDVREGLQLLRDRFDQLEHQKKFDFQLGEQVWWRHSKRGTKMSGKVTKINPKTIQVTLESGQGWRVSPSLLNKVSAS